MGISARRRAGFRAGLYWPRAVAAPIKKENAFMQIYQRGKRGTWWVRFTAPDHRRKHQSLGTTNKMQAAELADKLKSEF